MGKDLHKWKYTKRCPVRRGKFYGHRPTLRECKQCKKVTKWIYHPRAGHSRCGKCGFHYVKKKKNKKF